jgi:hypothetical protein
MFNLIASIVAAAVLALAFYDAWTTLGALMDSLVVVLALASILGGSYITSRLLGRRTGRHRLLNGAFSSILVLALVGYIGYAATAVVRPRMHIAFFPILLAILSVVLMGACAAVAYIWPRESNNSLERTRER